MRRLFLFSSLALTAGTCFFPLALVAQGKATVRQAPKPAAVAKARPGAVALTVSSWTGPMEIAATTIVMGLTISRQGENYTGSFDIPGGTIRHRRLLVSERADTPRLMEPSLSLELTLAVSPDGQLLTGEYNWAVLGIRLPVVFHRGTPTATAIAAKSSRAPLGRSAYSTAWEKGDLENGKPVGLWNYYKQDAAGNYVLARSYNHTTRQLEFARPENEDYDAQVWPGVWERVILPQAPWFIGKHDALITLINKVQYHSQARARRVEGKVWVTFAVDTLGRVSDHRIVKGLGNGCDEEALRVAQTFPDTWTPGRLGSKAVVSRQTFTISFKLT